MPYTADISRTNPGCFLFLVDRSKSMEAALAGQPGQRKMDQAADAINRILDAVSQRCSQGMDIRDYFHIGILGYNTDSSGSPIVASILNGTTPEQPFLLISQVVEVADVVERQVRESDGAGGVIEVTRRMPVWLQPHAEFGTPMCAALQLASNAVGAWVAQNPNSFPPIVINVTDGDASDGDPVPFGQQIMNLQTNDGNALLFNVHLSEMAAMPVQFPDREDGLPDQLAVRLFQMSSVFPEASRALAASLDLAMSPDSRGFVFNADAVALVQFLDLGTRGPSMWVCLMRMRPAHSFPKMSCANSSGGLKMPLCPPRRLQTPKAGNRPEEYEDASRWSIR